MKKQFIYAAVVALMLVFGFGVASATSTWSDDNVYTGVTNWFQKSIRIGQQGTGGVTFFNGTIINETTTSGVDNPVTFGDNVRIDGEIFRTEVGGTHPLKVSDTIIPMTSETYSLGTSSNMFKDGYFSGTLNTGSVNTGTLYVQSINMGQRGIAKAGGVITSAGVNESSFNGLGESITVTKAGLGSYEVAIGGAQQGDLGGSGATLSDAFGQIYCSIDPATGTKILVHTADSTGAAADRGFSFIVH